MFDIYYDAVLRTKSGYLAYIDFGLVSEVPLSVRESLVVALMHLIHGEYTKLAESFAGLALMGSDDLQLDLPVLSEALRDALQAPSESSVTGFTLVGMVGKLIPLGTRFPFVFNDYFLNNLRCLAMLEGLALNADPTFNILSVVYPYVASKIVTIPRPRYQEALESIIVDSYGRMRWTRMEKLLRDMDVKDSEDVKNNGRKQRKGTAANMVLSFIAGREGRMLRRYIVQQTLVSVEERWRAKVDVMLGRSSAATEENRVEKAARGRTEAFFGSAGVGRRMAVWIRIAPGFLWPFMKVVWRVVMHAVKGVEREKKKVVRGTEERERQWSAFDSTFFRRLEAQQALGSDSDAGVILK